MKTFKFLCFALSGVDQRQAVKLTLCITHLKYHFFCRRLIVIKDESRKKVPRIRRWLLNSQHTNVVVHFLLKCCTLSSNFDLLGKYMHICSSSTLYVNCECVLIALHSDMIPFSRIYKKALSSEKWGPSQFKGLLYRLLSRIEEANILFVYS